MNCFCTKLKNLCYFTISEDENLTFLQAHYTDPQTKLYYATTDEFMTVRSLPMDITAGYLALRGASSIVG